MSPGPDTVRLIERVMSALDYDVLGDVYCDEGGAAFWADRRPAVLEQGLALAVELGRRLRAGGRSLYVGAGVAELPVLISEVVDHDRRCVALNLRARECEVLNAALRTVELGERLQFEARDAATVALPECDHVAAVSVLDDPETFPWIAQVTYGRASPVDLDVVAFAAERERVTAIVDRLLDCLVLPGTITTSIEEVAWFAAAAERRGLAVEVEDEVVETALVGDPISFVTLREGA